MVDFLSGAPLTQQGGESRLTPDAAFRDSTAPTISQEQMDALSVQTFNTTTQGFNLGRSRTQIIGNTLVGTSINLADNIWSSPLNPVTWVSDNAEPGDTWKLAAQLGAADSAQFYRENKDMIDTTSGVVGGLLTMTLGDKGLTKGMRFALGSSSALTRTAPWQAAFGWEERARKAVLLAQQDGLVARNAVGLLNTSEGRNFLLAKVATNTGVAARQEALMYGVLWNNDFVVSEDATENAFWSGVGIAMGAAGGAIQSRAILRKGANGADAIAALSNAVPMAGVSDALTRDVDFAAASKASLLGTTAMDSVEFTSFAVASRANNTLNVPAALSSEINSMRNSAKTLMSDSLGKMLSKRVPGMDVVPAPVAKTQEAAYIVNEVVPKDTHVMHGVVSVGFPATKIGDAIKARVVNLTERFEKLQIDAVKQTGRKALLAREEAAKVSRHLKEQPMVFLNGRWVAPDSKLVAQAERFDQKIARSKIKFDEASTAVKTTLPNSGEIVFDQTLTMSRAGASARRAQMGGAKTLRVKYATLDATDRLYAQEAMRTMVSKATALGDKFSLIVNDSVADDWLALDLAEEVQKAGGKIKFDPTAKVTNLDQARRQSLTLKSRELLAEAGPTGIIDEEMRLRYNLPEPTTMERLEDPNGTNFRNWLQAAATGHGTAAELARGLEKNRVIDDLDLIPAYGAEPVPLHGNFLKWNRDKAGNFMRPMVGYHLPESQIAQISRRGADEAMTLKVQEKIATLLDLKSTKNSAQSQKFSAELTRELVTDENMQLARKTSGLDDAQITGTGRSVVGQIIGEILPKKFLHRDNPVLQAAARLREKVIRMADMKFTAWMKEAKIQDLLTKMDTPNKAALNAQLSEYYSLAGGWQIVSHTEIEPGWFAFQLGDTMQNRKALGVNKITNGHFAMNERLGKPIMVNAEALEAILNVSKMTDSLLDSANLLRKARGLNPISQRAYYVPPPKTKGKFIGFVFDENGEMVARHGIVASSESEYKAIVDKILEESPTGWTVREKEMLSRTKDVWDSASMDWIDQGMSAATLGIGQKTGGLTGQFVDSEAFTGVLEWVKGQLRNQAGDTLNTMMAEPLRLARMRAAVSDPRRLVGNRLQEKHVTRNVFDEYEQALTGNSYSYRESAVMSKVFTAAETAVDKALASSGIHIGVSHVMDVARRFGVSPTALSNKRTYQQILMEMGDKSPFKDAVDFLESKGHRQPATMKGIASKLNAIATNVVLRWDPACAHATMNMLGLIPTLTAGVRAGSAPITTQLAVKGRRVGFVDGVRIIGGALKDYIGKDARATRDRAYMVAHGFSQQSAVEYREMLGSIDSQAGFMKFANKIDSALAWASDPSESLSRQIAHLTGLRVADAQGIKTMAARHEFAHEFANAAIADYTPANRPELYNTAFGSMFGLFQSYVVNQYTKMFHWLEDGNYAAMGRQAAWQASLFGLDNTYGLGTLFGIHDSLFQETGEPNLLDAAYHRFGPEVGSALMTGGFGALTGISLWTRGDVQVRTPFSDGQITLQDLPSADVMVRFGKMFTGVVSEGLNRGPIDAMPAMLEIVQREMPNRMLKGILAVAAMDGKETDRFGSVMTETRTWMDTVARLAGVRSARMQQELEVFYANKSDVDKDAARAESVRMRMRTDMRTAERNGTSINPSDYFDDYVASGGNPRRFKVWIKQNLEEATTVRSARQLKKNLDTPRNRLHLWRYGAYGAWGIDDGTEPEN